MKDNDMSVLYHPGKINIVVDALSRFSTNIVGHVDDWKELPRDVHTLAQLSIQLEESAKGGVIIHYGFESSFASALKNKQCLDQIFEKLNETVLFFGKKMLLDETYLPLKNTIDSRFQETPKKC